MLNYCDAIAHLHIARRVLDSRTPRLSQLGSVWLPLPHILLIPFTQNYYWWATGLAGVIPSSLAYIASCAGIHRLARHWLNPAAALLALIFFALNPNLLYLQTTAMTEPLFLCEVIWIVVWLVEWRIALDGETEAASYHLHSDPFVRTRSRRRLAAFARLPLRIFEVPGPIRGAWLGNPLAQPAPRTNIPFTQTASLQASIAAALVAAIFTRYDGWIIALLAWTAIGLTLLKRAAAGERGRLRVYPHIRVASDGSHFFSCRGARSNAYRGPHERSSWGGYRVSASDERQRNGEKWPRPFGLRRRLGQTALSASTLEPPKPSASALSGPTFARNADYPYMWIHPRADCHHFPSGILVAGLR
jgi:hypothetical protein